MTDLRYLEASLDAILFAIRLKDGTLVRRGPMGSGRITLFRPTSSAETPVTAGRIMREKHGNELRDVGWHGRKPDGADAQLTYSIHRGVGVKRKGDLGAKVRYVDSLNNTGMGLNSRPLHKVMNKFVEHLDHRKLLSKTTAMPYGHKAQPHDHLVRMYKRYGYVDREAQAQARHVANRTRAGHGEAAQHAAQLAANRPRTSTEMLRVPRKVHDPNEWRKVKPKNPTVSQSS